MKLPFLILAALPAFAEPAFELTADWFALDATGVVTNGVTVAKSAAGLVFTPALPLPATAPAALTARVTFTEADVGAARRLVAPADGAQFALTVAATAQARLAFFGWTSFGWVELAGADPVIGTPMSVRIEIDYGVSPAEVRYVAGGQTLVAADGSGRDVFTAAAGPSSRFDATVAEGEIGVTALAGQRELIERISAVTDGDTVLGYYPSLAAARAAAAPGEVVTLLRRTSFADAQALSGETVVAPTALRGGTATLTYTGEATDLEAESLVFRLPAGYDLDIPFLAPTSTAVLAAVHVHGDSGVPYTLYPADGAFNLRRDALVLDGGGFTTSFTAPEGGRSYLRDLADASCGSENALYLNGLGSLTLCGTNAFTGKVFLESSQLVTSGGQPGLSPEILASPSGVSFAVSPNEGASGGTVIANNAVVLSGVTDAMVTNLTFTLNPGTGRLGYLKREGTALVAKIATAPTLSSNDAFSVSAPLDATGNRQLVATLANAVAGFRYGWVAADNLDEDFQAVGEVTVAPSDGPLEVRLSDPPKVCRFYRFRVEAPK